MKFEQENCWSDRILPKLTCKITHRLPHQTHMSQTLKCKETIQINIEIKPDTIQ